ncbi:MAG: hypothetical protein JST86_12550 [Bacteroidetes bacterium]|nr:hypothetical protein [Bacteroidota bacterium]
MKKITLIFLITIYSLSVVGLGVRQFYCCGKLKSTTVTFVQEVKEKCSSSNAMKDCCKTKYQSLKVKDSHFGTDGITGFVKHFTILHSTVPFFQETELISQPVTIVYKDHAPPPQNGVAVYIRNCVFLI